MREVMAAAPVGDDVFGDDPTVNDLEAFTAELLGKEAGMFVPSGTQSNLCALLAHCQRGDEYIVGDHAHTYWYEAGGAAVLGSIQPQPVRMLDSGMIDLDHVARVVKPDDVHFARSRLLCAENTHDGKVIDIDTLNAGAEAAEHHGLSYHLDGARIWNAAVGLGVTAKAVAESFDTVSVCLSKGLGAPVGSVLVGPQPFIDEARKWRKMLGGGMRQVGLLAAAGRYALDNHIDRLADDHVNAARIAEGLANIDGIRVTGQATNMVFADMDSAITAAGLADGEAFAGALASDHNITMRMVGNTTRIVTHIGVSVDDADAVVSACTSVLT